MTTTRVHVHYVVPENGIANFFNLFGENLKQRTKALIAKAHPSAQDTLDQSVFDHFKTLI